MSKDFNTALKERRTYYGISKESKISNAAIKKIVEDAVMYSPSAFNSQSTRAVVLFGKHHDKLWSIAKDALRKIVPAENFATTEEKINSFANGYATVLYFEDTDVVKGLQEKFAMYKDNFPIWAQQSQGMLQLAIWTALENEGLGVSLQHYNPIIDSAVKKEWDIPESWQLVAQMPFGTPTAQPDEKAFLSINDRIKVFE